MDYDDGREPSPQVSNLRVGTPVQGVTGSYRTRPRRAGSAAARDSAARSRTKLSRKPSYVSKRVQQTHNGLLEAEAEQLCWAGRYERPPDRLDPRAGHYKRRLQTRAGDVTLRVPRLRSLPFETQIIERYRIPAAIARR